MADSSRHTSTFPELYRLYNSLGSSHIPIFAQNVLRNPASQPAPQSPSPTSTTPLNKRIHPRDRNPGFYAIVHGSTHIFLGTVGAPVERVYLLLQCQNEMLKYGHISSPYKGIKDCFLRTIKHEGLLSLWRGNSMNVISILTSQVYVSALVFLKRNGYPGKEMKELPFWNPCFCGMLGMFGLLFTYPFFYARIRLANDVKAARNSVFSLDSSCKSFSNAVGNRKFNGVFDVFKKTLQLEGSVGLYRGYTFGCVVAFAYSATEVIKSQYRKDKQPYSALIITCLASMSVPVVVYPVRTVSHRMMMTCGETTKYKGAVDAVRQIVKHEGVSSLYRGLTASLLCSATKFTVLCGLWYFVPLYKQL